MRSLIEIDRHKAVVACDPEIAMFRGDFRGISGGAEFRAQRVAGLEAKGRKSLET